jgi:hypothetical protein
MTLRRLEQVNGCLFIAFMHSNCLLEFSLVSFHPAFYNLFLSLFLATFALHSYKRTKNNTATLTLQRRRTTRRVQAGRRQAENTQQPLAG